MPTPPRLCNQCQRSFLPEHKVKKFNDKEYHEVCLTKFLEVRGKRTFVRTIFYPFLEETSSSIEDAKIFAQALSVAIEQEFANRKKIMNVKALKLLDKLDPKAEHYAKYKQVIKMFNDESVADALEIISGMSGAIDSFIKEEMTKRDLKSLKVDFLE